MSRKSLLGIDIGSYSVKLVELKRIRNKLYLKSLGEIAIPPKLFGTFVGIGNVECLSVLSSYIKKLMSNLNLHTNDAITALPPEEVFTTTINLPLIPSDEVDFAMKWEIKKQISDYPEKKTASWKVVNKNNYGLEVFVAVVPKMLASRYLTVIKESGLNLVSLEIEPLALARSLVLKKEEGVVIVDFGTVFSSISLVEGGNIKITRNLKIGERDMIKSLVKTAGDVERAKGMLYSTGFLKTTDTKDAHNSLKPLLSSLILEIKRFSTYFQEKMGQDTSGIILSGGPAAVPNIVDYISKTVSMPVNIVDPWVNIDVSYIPDRDKLKPMASRFAVATGLAMVQ